MSQNAIFLGKITDTVTETRLTHFGQWGPLGTVGVHHVMDPVIDWNRKMETTASSVDLAW